MSAKQAVNDKLQGSVATYLRCGGVVNNQMEKGLLLSLRVKFKIGDLAKLQQERYCLMHFVRLSNTQLNDRESARNNHILASNFAKYSPILTLFSLTE